MSGRLEVSVLGPVRAWSHGRLLHLGPTRQRTVFAVLVAAANRVVTAAELIAAVWGGSPPATARDNLYTYVSGLRREVTGDLVESRADGYLLRLGAGDRDSERFTTMLAGAQAWREAGDTAGAASLLDDALRLWRGEAYADLEAEIFTVERSHLDRLRLDAVEQRIRMQVENGDDVAIAELSALVREHPLHETWHELLMRALYRAGRRAEAVTAFQRARSVFATELGVEPSPRLRQLHRQIIQSSPQPEGSSWEGLRDDVREVLRLAVLLDPHLLRAETLAAVAGRPPLEVLNQLDDVLATGVLTETAAGLAFSDHRMPATVLNSIPPPARAQERRRLAESLARAGSPAEQVAGQLTAEPLTADGWMLSWAVTHLDEVSDQAPQTAMRLSRLLLDSPLPTDRQRGALLAAYARSAFRCGEPVALALELVTEPALRAEMRQISATVRLREGDLAGAGTLLAEALADRQTPPIWRIRHRTLFARAAQAGEPFDATAALQAEWHANSINRDHAGALRHADRALGLLGRRTTHAALELDLLDNRIFSLQNLDRTEEVDRDLHQATLIGIRHRLAGPLAITAAVHDFWTGRWGDAVTQLSVLTDDDAAVGMFGMREQRAGILLRHGVAALIAAHRGELERAAAHLRTGQFTVSERESGDFLLAARAAIAEQSGRPADCLDILAPLLHPGYAPLLLRHQWLPDLVRCARRAGRKEIAEQAVEQCAREASEEVIPARAVTALARCQALMSGDPQLALDAAERYRSVGRPFERAAALEDAAVLLAAKGRAADATRYGRTADLVYQDLGAHWDRQRLRSRVAARD